MSTHVENMRIDAEFNSDKFEKNIKAAMNDIDELNEKLKFEGVEEGLSNFSKFSRKFDLSNIGEAVESVADRFSAFGIIGMRVLENLTDRAVDFGIQFAKSMAIDPILDGWSKYESTNKSTISVMNQTGKSVEEVSEELDKLALYADYTSFNMSSMSQALTAFISKGVSLEDAIPAIMGIGNSVTFLGKSAQESSHAFEIYSKAMGMGIKSQQLWNQLSYGGYVGPQLKWQFLEAAEAAKTLIKVEDGLWKVNDGSKNPHYVRFEDFESTLQEGWLTRDVATSVLAGTYGDFANKVIEFAKEQEKATGVQLTYDEAVTGYIKKIEEEGGVIDEQGKKYLESATLARTYADAVDAVKDAVGSLYKGIFSSIFGDVEKATKFWTEFSEILNDFVTKPLTKLKELVDKLAKNSVFDLIWTTLKMLPDRIQMFIAPIRDAFNSVFGGAITKDWAQSITDLIRTISVKIAELRPSERYLSNMKDVFSGLFSLIKIVGDMIGDVTQVTKPLGTVIQKVTGYIFDAAAALGRLLTQIEPFIKSMYDSWLKSDLFFILKKPFNELKKGATIVYDTLGAFVERIGKEGLKLGDITDFLVGSIGGVVGAISDLISSVTGWDNSKFVSDMIAFGETVRDFVIDKFELLRQIVKNTFGEDATLFTILGDVLTGFAGVLSTVGQTVKKWAGVIKEGLDKLFGDETMDRAALGANLMGVISDKLTVAFDAIKKALSWLAEQIKIFFGGQITLETVLTTLQRVANIIITLNLSKALSSVSGFFDGLSSTLNAFARAIKPAGKGIKMAAAGILMIAAAMLMLAALKPDAMYQAIHGLIGASTALAILVAAFSKFDKGTSKFKFNLKDLVHGNSLSLGNSTVTNTNKINIGMFGQYSGLVAMAIMVMMLANAITTIAESSASKEQLDHAAGIIILTSVIIGLISKIPVLNDQTKGFGRDGGKGLLLMSISMFVLAKSFAAFGELNETQYERGKTVMWSLLGGLAAMVAVAGITKGDVNFQPKAFLTMSTALAAIAFAIKQLGDIPPDQLQQGYTALAIMTIVIGGVMTVTSLIAKGLSSSGSEFVAIGNAFLKMTLGLLVLAGALKLISTIQGPELVAGVLGLGGMLIVFAGALGGLYALTASMEGGQSLVSIAAAIVVLSSAMLILSVAFIAMGKADKVGASIGAMLAMLILLTGVAAIMKANGLTEQFNALAKVFTAFGIALAAAAIALTVLSVALVPFVGQLLVAVPMILGVIVELLAGLTVILPMIVGLIGAFLTSILNLLISMFPKIGETIIAFFDMIADILIALIWPLAKIVVMAILGILKAVNEYIEPIAEQVVLFVLKLIAKICDLIVAYKNDIYTLIKIAFSTVVDLLIAWLGEIIADFVSLISKDGGEQIRKAFKKVTDQIDSDIADAKSRLSFEATAAGEEIIGSPGAGSTTGLAGGMFSALGSVSAATDSARGLIQNPLKADIASGFLRQIGFDTFGEIGAGGQDFLNTGMFEDNGAEAVTRTVEEMVKVSGTDMIRTKVTDAYGKVSVYWRNASAEDKAFYQAGLDALKGYAQGLKDPKLIKEIGTQGTVIGQTTLKNLRIGLGERSPSRYAREAGKFVNEGLALGLGDNIPVDEAESIGDEILKALAVSLSKIQSLMDSELDLNPTITPVMDLTELKKGIGVVNGITGAGTITTSKVYDTAASATTTKTVQNASTPSSVTTNYTFNQTNNSPKALNRTEIYRQTSNQFASFANSTKGGGGKITAMTR